MRVGIVGCGNIAQVHGWVLQQISNVQLVALSDHRDERANKLSEKYTDGNASVYSDYIEMLEKADLDAVHICTSHYLHVPMAIEALKRNVSVFMEKPPAITMEEFEELKRAAEKSKARIGFCFQNRYNATTLKVDELVAKKELGELIGVRSFVTWKREKEYYSDDWHGNLHKEGGGVLISQAIHTLDLVLRYLGKPEKVAASMHNHHLEGLIEVEDTMESIMEFQGGKRAAFYATTAYSLDAPVIIELNFEEGHITVVDQSLIITKNGAETVTITCKNKPGIGKSYWGSGHLACIEDFYKCLDAGTPYQNDLESVSNTMATMIKMYEAAGRYFKREVK